MSFFYEDNSNPSGDNGHYFYGTEEAQFSTCTSSFSTDEVFGSREDMMNWVKHTAYSLGYVIVAKRSKQCKNGLTNKLVLMCDPDGKPRGSIVGYHVRAGFHFT
nr:PKS-NRPS hybrid synthetase-like [Tanacetum cinerariifolium]